MKLLSAFLSLFVVNFGLKAATPAFTDFYGTNGIIIQTNGNKVQVRAATTVVTNIVGGGSVLVTSNNLGTYTIFGMSTNGVTNIVILTNGVALGNPSALNFSSGITGYLSGITANLGVNLPGGLTTGMVANANIWTNDNARIRPIVYPTFRLYPTNDDANSPILIMGGAGASNWMASGYGGTLRDYSIFSANIVAEGDLNNRNIGVASAQDTGGARYGYAAFETRTNQSMVFTETLITGGGINRFVAGHVDGTGNIISLQTNSVQAFKVDGAGGISLMKAVPQNWPDTQGGVATVLTNDGAGNLGWGAGGGGIVFSELVWTNDNGVLKPIAFPTNIVLNVSTPDNGTSTNFYFDSRTRRTNAASKLFQIYNGGSNALTIGPNGGLFAGRGNPTPVPGAVLFGVFDTALGETNSQEIFTMSQNSAVGYNGAADLLVNTNYSSLQLFANKEGGVKFGRFNVSVGSGLNPQDFNTFEMQWLSDRGTFFHIDPNFTSLTRTNYLLSSSVRVTNTHILLSLQNSNTPVLEVDGVGDLRMIKRVPYVWPAAQGAAATALTNEGAGNLGWGTASSGVATGTVANANIWTNDNGRSVRLHGYPVTFRLYPTNLNSTTPQIMMGGTNGSNWFVNGLGVDAQRWSLASVRVANDGDLQRNNISVASAQDAAANSYGIASLYTQTNFSYVQTESRVDGTINTFTAGRTGTQSEITLVTNNSDAFKVDGAGGISLMKGIAQNWPDAQGAASSLLTNDGSGNLGWSTALSPASILSGTTNFMNLSVQAAKLPATNYPSIDAGWQAWETIYYETNDVGNRANLNASWQFIAPPDYTTNSLQLLVTYSLLNTNGPNTSNVIFGASAMVARSGTTNNVHTNAFGFTAWGTNDWIAKYDGTNIVTNLVINLGTNAALKALDLSVLKLERNAVNDTFGGAVAIHGLQLQYLRQ